MKFMILGSSAAGMNGARELRRCNPDAEIIIISKDENVYSRCILHHYLSGERDEKGISFIEEDFEERYQIQFIGGNACTQLKAGEKKVVLEDGSELSYDKLLIATGANSFLPPVEGLREASFVYGFRNLDDIVRIKEASKLKNHIVILGGGLVGVDALSGLIPLNKTPALVEVAGNLLSRQLDMKASSAYEKAFMAKGVKFYFNSGIKKVVMNEALEVCELVLIDDTIIPCDMLIVTAGVRANLSFINASEIEADKFGLIINTEGATSDPDVFGAGDVTGRSPIWPNAVKEGIIAARNMSGIKSTMTDFFASKSTMNFEGIESLSLGVPVAEDDTYNTDIREDKEQYKKIIHKNGRIYGAIIQGDLSYAGILTQLIANKIDVSKVKKPLFDIDYSDFFNMNENFEFYYEGEV